MATSQFSYSITLDTKEAILQLHGLAERIPAAIKAWLVESAELAQHTVVDYAPQGVTGDLQESVKIAYNLAGQSATVGTSSPYARAVEKGTRPHMPPVDALRPWAEMHGIDPWAVAMGIKKHGTKAQPFFEEAVKEVTPVITRNGAKILSRALKE